MRQLYLLAFLCLFSLTFANVHHRFLNQIQKAQSEQNLDFDICSELRQHINNLKINAETYNDIDEEFPHNQDSVGMSLFKQVTWTKMADIAISKGYTVKIFGENGINPADIKQGDVGDCYFLSALTGLANSNPEYIYKLFDEQTELEKQKGIFTTNWLLNGEPVKVSVDSWIPTYVQDGEPVFASFKNDFEFWPIILEKAWAKIYGSYGNIEAGCTSQAYRSLSNAPPFAYTHSLVTQDYLWNVINTQIANHMPLSVSSQSYSLYNIPKSHAYAPLATCEHQYPNGTLLRLVKMSNPWGVEVYKGPFNDYDAQWTQELREKCGSIPGNDGEFFMPINIYKLVYISTQGVKLQNGYTNNIYPSDEFTNDNVLYEDSYEINIQPGSEAASIYIGVDFLDIRFNSMLPESCAFKKDYFSAYIMTPDFSVLKSIFDDSQTSNFHIEVSGYTKYYIFVKRQIQTQVVKDYVVSVYAPDQSVTIFKSNVLRTDLFLNNLEINQKKGVAQTLKPDVNIISKVPITGDTYSSGIILDNKSSAKKLNVQLIFYTNRYDIVADFCKVDTSYISSYKKYICETIVYPNSKKPILIQHSNEFGATYTKCYFKYSVQ